MGKQQQAEHHRKLERMYHAAPINRFCAPKLQVSRGKAVLTFETPTAFFHAAHALHGSVYFKALDDAAFFAVNSLVPEHFVLTVSFNIYLLRPVTGGTLRAEGVVTSRSRTLYVAESVLYLVPDRQVARGSGSFVRSNVLLKDVAAYQ